MIGTKPQYAEQITAEDNYRKLAVIEEQAYYIFWAPEKNNSNRILICAYDAKREFNPDEHIDNLVLVLYKTPAGKIPSAIKYLDGYLQDISRQTTGSWAKSIPHLNKVKEALNKLLKEKETTLESEIIETFNALNSITIAKLD